MSESTKTQKPRILYIDNLRIFLIFLVVLHHWAIANGAPGDWYIKESNLSEVGNLLFTMFVATNQSFFMGFFFFISAYFIPASLSKKGDKLYLSERFKRLGIPLIFYFLVISPFINFLVEKFSNGFNGNYLDFLMVAKGIFSPGPLWFVALLLIFSVLYLLFGKMNMGIKKNTRAFNFRSIHIFQITIFVIVVTYIIRIFYPVGHWIPVLGIQPAHLTQYVVCFILGIAAFKFNSLAYLNFAISKRLLIIGQALIIIVFPGIFLITGGAGDVDLFMGGFTYQSLIFTIWEQLVAVSLIIGLLGIFRKYFNVQNNLARDLSKNSYAIYVLHGIPLVALSLTLQSLMINSMYKFLLFSVPALILCYLLAKLVRQIPVVSRIL